MIDVTWAWLGQGLGLDLANTVAIENGTEHDFIASFEEFDRWAALESEFLPGGGRNLLLRARPRLLDLRTVVREGFASIAANEKVPATVADALNGFSRLAPEWLKIDMASWTIREETSASDVDKLLAHYARSAMQLVAYEATRIKRCPAPSCGMFYVSSRSLQRWCSSQCGSRARVARYYRRQLSAAAR